MWPDVEIKRNPNFPIVAQNVNPSKFSLTETFFKIAQKVPKYLCYFYKQICCKELSKIAQSGHTDWAWLVVIRYPSLTFIKYVKNKNNSRHREIDIFRVVSNFNFFSWRPRTETLSTLPQPATWSRRVQFYRLVFWKSTRLWPTAKTRWSNTTRRRKARRGARRWSTTWRRLSRCRLTVCTTSRCTTSGRTRGGSDSAVVASLSTITTTEKFQVRY